MVGGDGIERKVDTLICATGFDVTYKPRFPMVGKNGVNLYVPESYLSLGVPDMPNFIMFVGPTWYIPPARVVTLSNIANSLLGSVTGPLLLVLEYVVQIIKMQKDHIKSWVPKQDIIPYNGEVLQESKRARTPQSEVRVWSRSLLILLASSYR